MNSQVPEQTKSNENISISHTLSPGCIIDVKANVTPLATQASYEKAIRNIRKEASLPGFRKGKLTKEIVLKHFQKNIEDEARHLVLSTGFEEATTMIGRRPFSKHSVLKSSINSFDLEKGSVLHFAYEATPEVPELNIPSLTIETATPKDPTDQEIEEFYKRVQLMFSDKKPVERAACKGDATILSIHKDGEPTSQKSHFYLFPELVPDWLFEAVVGMEKGTSKLVEIPPSKSNPDQKQSATVTVESIFECSLMEENDEFAKKAGAPSLGELKEKIRENLLFKASQTSQERMRKQVKNELIRQFAFDLPQSLVEGETDARFRPYWETVLKQSETPPEKEATRKPFLDEVKRHFTCFFLLQQLFPKLEEKYSQNEIMEELQKQMNDVSPQQCVLYPNLQEKEVVDRLLANILIRQAMDYCIEQKLGIAPPKPPQSEKTEQQEMKTEAN